MESEERKVEAQDDAKATNKFPKKKERRAKRKQIISTIKKYSMVNSLKRKIKKAEEEEEKLQRELVQRQHSMSPEKHSEVVKILEDTREHLKATTEILNGLVDPTSEDPGIQNPQFFFLRDKDERPVVCICDLVYFGQTYRGIAVTSPLEFTGHLPDGRQKFCKATGRKIAFDRAIAAIMSGESCMPVRRPEAREVLTSVGFPWPKQGEAIFKAQVGSSEIDKGIATAYRPRKG